MVRPLLTVKTDAEFTGAAGTSSRPRLTRLTSTAATGRRTGRRRYQKNDVVARVRKSTDVTRFRITHLPSIDTIDVAYSKVIALLESIGNP